MKHPKLKIRRRVIPLGDGAPAMEEFFCQNLGNLGMRVLSGYVTFYWPAPVKLGNVRERAEKLCRQWGKTSTRATASSVSVASGDILFRADQLLPDEVDSRNVLPDHDSYPEDVLEGLRLGRWVLMGVEDHTGKLEAWRLLLEEFAGPLKAEPECLSNLEAMLREARGPTPEAPVNQSQRRVRGYRAQSG